MYSSCNATTHDLSDSLGYTLWLRVNHWQHDVPLQWCTFNEDEIIERGNFLYSPGIPLDLILTGPARESIPPAILKFSELLPALQYQLLQGIQVSEASRELAFSAPLLFLFVVYQANRLSVSQDDFAALVLNKRTELLRFCGLPATASLKRLVGRIEVRAMLLDDFLFVHQSLQDTKFTEKLRYIPRLNTHQLTSLRYYAGPFWPGFLAMLEPEMEVWQQRLVRRMAEDVGRMGATPAHLQGINTYQDLQALHDRLVERRNRLLRARGGERRRLLLQQYQEEFGDFPPPPFPGNDEVVPLESWEALLDEGEAMRHCVSGYGKVVGQQTVFIYKVLKPQRLTMALNKTGDRWLVSEVRGVCNSAATEEAMNVIKEWFISANKPDSGF